MKGKSKKPFECVRATSAHFGSGLKRFSVLCTFWHTGERKTKTIYVTGYDGKKTSVTRRAILKRAKATIISKRILAPFGIWGWKQLREVKMELAYGEE